MTKRTKTSPTVECKAGEFFGTHDIFEVVSVNGTHVQYRQYYNVGGRLICPHPTRLGFCNYNTFRSRAGAVKVAEMVVREMINLDAVRGLPAKDAEWGRADVAAALRKATNRELCEELRRRGVNTPKART